MRLGSLPSSVASGTFERDRQRIPGGDIEPGHRHAHDALHADQREAGGELAPQIERARPRSPFTMRSTSSSIFAIAGIAAGK